MLQSKLVQERRQVVNVHADLQGLGHTIIAQGRQCFAQWGELVHWLSNELADIIEDIENSAHIVVVGGDALNMGMTH